MTEDFDCNDFLDTDFAVDGSCSGAPATVWWNQGQREAERRRMRREEDEWLVVLL